MVCALGPLPVGGTALVTLTVAYGPDTPLGAAPNTAAVETVDRGPDAREQLRYCALTVTGEADLSITKTGTPNPVIAGQPVTFTVTVSTAALGRRGVAVHDVLPPEFTFGSSAPSQGTCARRRPLAPSTARSVRSLLVPRRRS